MTRIAEDPSGSSIHARHHPAARRLHVEFRLPFTPRSRGRSRANSGVFVNGCYEVQVLDSFGEAPHRHHAGGIYGLAAPRVNASLPPLVWQTFDIALVAPRFAGAEKSAAAVLTVHHNGILIHDRVVVPRGTKGAEQPRGPILLQQHGSPVAFRNIWIQEGEGR